MGVHWPNKTERQYWEIKRFIRAYASLPRGRRLALISIGDRPDCIVIDRATAEQFGVELTSVYSDDRSVPDEHMVRHAGLVHMPFDQGKLDRYEQRLLDAVEKKIQQARRGYDTNRPLILSVYVNEYISIYLEGRDWEVMTTAHRSVFDQIAPFVEVVFWRGNRDAFSVRPSPTRVMNPVYGSAR